MFKALPVLKDTYITNRVINGISQVSGNVGSAGSLDLFKLYGLTSTTSGTVVTPNIELSRMLVQFDLTSLRAAAAAGQIDVTNPSFSCRLHLYDVYGGQPTPTNFSVSVFPMSASFDEGLGRDVVFYSDEDTCNWISGSKTGGPWNAMGCASGGTSTSTSDYITTLQGMSLEATQTFVTGEEDLDVDVTLIVSATLAGLLPDVGFRISFDPSLEANQYTYFVKRFASRTAFNTDLCPQLFVRYDDSIQDDTDNVFLDSPSYMFLYNYVRSTPANLMSASVPVTGSDSVVLQLTTVVSGGNYSFTFPGSQHVSGRNPVTGIYSASVMIPSSDPLLVPQLQASGSLTFVPTWQSVDGTLTYLVGDPIKVFPPQRGPASLGPKRFEVSVIGVPEEVGPDEVTS